MTRGMLDFMLVLIAATSIAGAYNSQEAHKHSHEIAKACGVPHNDIYPE